MKLIRSIAAGLAGAVALNILHETMRNFDPSAPRVDLLGEEALVRTSALLEIQPPEGKHLYELTLAGDIISNTAYYTMIGLGGRKGLFLRAATMGLTAGLGAIKLPEPMGLDSTPLAGSEKRMAMTVGYYVFGALVTATVLKLISKK